MNRITLGGFLAAICLMSLSFSVENEFVVQKKEKIFYPSNQQYIELDGEIIDVLNSCIKCLVDLQREAIAEINLYLEGDKDSFLQCATKHQKAKAYAHKRKIRSDLHAIFVQLSAMNLSTKSDNSNSIYLSSCVQ